MGDAAGSTLRCTSIAPVCEFSTGYRHTYGLASYAWPSRNWQALQRLDRILNLRHVLQTPASTLSVIGRASSAVWRELEERTKIWVRIYAEERGMVASQRLARGEVRSLIADMVNEFQPSVFLARLSQMSDAVIWDTRVWMGSMGSWPSAADRFAADLGWVDQISDKALRNLTLAIMESQIPVVAGGHGVVAGGLLALLETL